MRRFPTLVLLLLIVLSTVPSPVGAQGFSLTLTPPFVQISLAPGEYWAGSLRVVNTMTGDLPVYATVMDFAANDESGHGDFLPISPEAEGNKSILATWIELNNGPYALHEQQAKDIPFAIRVPQNASPGGHYAAILVGSKPFGDASSGGNAIRVSSYIAALIFVRVKGDVVESGSIREFSTDRSWYDTEDVKLSLRFENDGNVHIQPRGLITITDMWGGERAEIPVNNEDELGYVLPTTIRRFDYSWHPEGGLLALGRYRANVTLNYGSDNKQNVTRALIFWYFPLGQIFTVVGGTLLLLAAAVWLVRRYIRRALREQLRATHGTSVPPPNHINHAAQQNSSHDPSPNSGTVDLRDRRK